MLKDAHCHLHQINYPEGRKALIELQKSNKVDSFVVNGTQESDWTDVLTLAEQFPKNIIPSLGLHPWHVNQRSTNWFQLLEKLVVNYRTGIGEIGLDKWIKDYDINSQIDSFEKQLDLATRLNLPVSIHCLKAWGPLWGSLSSNPLPKRGVHIHGYGGSRETLEKLLPLPCYFSFSGYFLHPRKESTLQLYKSIPDNRILIESDAPAMLPPRDAILIADGSTNHPANMNKYITALAELRETSVELLTSQINANFSTYFEGV